MRKPNLVVAQEACSELYSWWLKHRKVCPHACGIYTVDGLHYFRRFSDFVKFVAAREMEKVKRYEIRREVGEWKEVE